MHAYVTSIFACVTSSSPSVTFPYLCVLYSCYHVQSIYPPSPFHCIDLSSHSLARYISFTCPLHLMPSPRRRSPRHHKRLLVHPTYEKKRLKAFHKKMSFILARKTIDSLVSDFDSCIYLYNCFRISVSNLITNSCSILH